MVTLYIQPPKARKAQNCFQGQLLRLRFFEIERFEHRGQSLEKTEIAQLCDADFETGKTLEITDAINVRDWPTQAIHDEPGNRGDELKEPEITRGAVEPVKPHFEILALPQDFLLESFECVSRGRPGKLDLVEMCLGCQGRDLVRIWRE